MNHLINHAVERASENTLLKRLNARLKEKEKNIKTNKKRYWKLSASEKLHYDSRVEKISKMDFIEPFMVTFAIAKIYLLVLVIFTLFKVLFNVDPVHLVKAFLTILGTLPILIRFSILLDIFLIVFHIGIYLWNKDKGMKYLNEKYGFKRV